jgi:HK97 family phage major capsid protein
MNLKQLRARLAAIKGEMQGLIDAGLDAEGQVKFDELEAEAKDVRANIDRLERFESADFEDQEPQGRQTAPQKPSKMFEGEARDNRQEDPNCGFNNLAELAVAVRNANPAIHGVVDDRLQILGAPSNPHQEGSSNDGYMVPPAMRDKIFELMFDEPDLLSMVDGEPTNSNSVQFLADETTPWGSTGIQAYWSAEAGQLQRSRLETKGRELRLHKLHAMVEATEELLEDAPRLNSRLTKGAARAMNWKANESLIYGSGAGQPLGFLNGGSVVTVAKETSQTAATIVAKNVAKMYSRAMNPSQCVWLVNQDTLPEFLTMTLGDKPIWTPPAEGFKKAPGGLLFGRPVMFTDQCDTLGTVNDIMFVNPKGFYLVNKRQGVKFASSIHLYFDFDTQAFKWTFRLGGQPYLSSAVSPNKGSATRSHFVTLATRA